MEVLSGRQRSDTELSRLLIEGSSSNKLWVYFPAESLLAFMQIYRSCAHFGT